MQKRTIGVISDTHGLLRPEILEALKGSELIIHGGDIKNIDDIKRLEEISPVVAVRGNIDRDPEFDKLKKTEIVEFSGHYIYIIHDIKELDIDPKAAGFNIIISGHSHMPYERMENNILYLNPGSAGPRRFNLPISAAILEFEGKEINVKFI